MQFYVVRTKAPGNCNDILVSRLNPGALGQRDFLPVLVLEVVQDAEAMIRVMPQLVPGLMTASLPRTSVGT